MSLFNKKKDNACCCGNCSPEDIKNAEGGKSESGIKILGGGCAKCHELENNTKSALATLGIDETTEMITDFAVIAAYGVMSTPALVIDGKVVSYGKVLKPDEIAVLLKNSGK